MMKRGSLILAAAMLLVVLAACGSDAGERKQVEALVTEAIQAYEGRESVELHMILTNDVAGSTYVQNDAMLWRHGENWLMETKIPMGDDVRLITQLQYGELLFTEFEGEVTCQELKLENVGQLRYEGFDSYEQQEDGSLVLSLERNATKTERQNNLVRRKCTITLDSEGNLVRLLAQDYNQQMDSLTQEIHILSWDTPICEEKIEAAYACLQAASE